MFKLKLKLLKRKYVKVDKIINQGLLKDNFELKQERLDVVKG